MSRITIEQLIPLAIVPRTEAGNIAPIDGAVLFASSNPDVATIEVLSDSTCNVVSVAIGVTQISAQFDADLGAGVRSIILTGAVEVVAAEAIAGELAFGTAVLKPVPPVEG